MENKKQTIKESAIDQTNIDLIVEQFKTDILKMSQNANLPFSIIYYVIKDIQHMLEKDYYNYITTLADRQEQ